MFTRDFTKENTPIDAFLEGREEGRQWEDCWAPGGPHVYSARFSSDPDWVAYCELTQACNDAWCAGWRHGMRERGLDPDDNRLPVWMDKNGNKWGTEAVRPLRDNLGYVYRPIRYA